jgi:hypothetical protein
VETATAFREPMLWQQLVVSAWFRNHKMRS